MRIEEGANFVCFRHRLAQKVEALSFEKWGKKANSSGVAAGMIQARHEPLSHWITTDSEDNGNGICSSLSHSLVSRANAQLWPRRFARPATSLRFRGYQPQPCAHELLWRRRRRAQVQALQARRLPERCGRLLTTAIRYELQGYSWVSGFDRRRTGAKSPSITGGSRPSSLYFAFKSSSVGMLTVTV